MVRLVSFLPGATAAAFASAALVIVFVLYLIPFGAIVCGPFVQSAPDIQSGEPFFEQATLVLFISRDRAHFVGGSVVRAKDLAARLEALRLQDPTLPLEIRADGRLPAAVVFEALGAARRAGYREAWVFGEPRSLVQVLAGDRSS